MPQAERAAERNFRETVEEIRASVWEDAAGAEFTSIREAADTLQYLGAAGLTDIILAPERCAPRPPRQAMSVIPSSVHVAARHSDNARSLSIAIGYRYDAAPLNRSYQVFTLAHQKQQGGIFCIERHLQDHSGGDYRSRSRNLNDKEARAYIKEARVLFEARVPTAPGQYNQKEPALGRLFLSHKAPISFDGSQ